MKVGLLPLYIKLYEDVAPSRHDSMQANAVRIADLLRQRGLNVVRAPICCLRPDFAAAVQMFEDEQVDAIVTLHLAYSPSLESADVLAGTALPIVVFDTTPDYEFGFSYGDKVMANHGIHGVQDMCNLLIRNKKPFLITAGPWQHPQVIGRLLSNIRTAAIAHKMQNLRVGSAGGSFDGMGDFTVPPGTFGMQVIPYEAQPEPSEAAIKAEIEADHARFVLGKLSPGIHEQTVAASLKIRSWLEQDRLDAFTICFLGITRADGWATVPFLEASKAMARRIGYAGEGDVLTAGLHAAIMTAFPETSFTEMFCPDWAGNRIFLSHMGEINIALTSQKPLLAERNYIFSDTGNPAIATGCFRSGKAMLIDLAPGPEQTFTLICALVTLEAPETPSTASNTGWFTPHSGTIGTFLENYSRLGGTHHILLSYDADQESLRDFAHLMQWRFAVI
ncbi:MAG TPA: hypothetical protein PKY10_13580 [Lentisphaeria bacterium]|nr:hypothetical protein [Lentisphaeria bacterium]